ncbi:MAG: hypothetical protein ACTIAA_03380 [Microbacterium sp.]
MSRATMHGWKVLAVLLALITACYAAFAWALSVLLLTALILADPSALATAGAHAFAWSGSMQVSWMWMLIGGMPAGMVLQGIAHYSSWWTERLPQMSDAPDAAALTGGGLGVLVAVAGAGTTLGWILGGAVFALFAFLAIRMLRRAVAETREQAEEIDRIDDLRAHGTRVRADVDAVHFLHTWIGELPLFEVTASYDTPSGRRTASGRVLSIPAGAPIVGGTVQLWFTGDGADSDNVDMDEDPQSIRDPDAAETYDAPPT